MEFNPKATANTEPSKLLSKTEIFVDNQATSAENFKPWYNMNFGGPESYTEADGIVTFRGNNFRDNPTYGNTNISSGKFEELWRANTGALPWGEESWSGSGWTGQPLVMTWSDEVKQHSNMYDWAKDTPDLHEVVYACMDGYVYFLDLETGKATRDPINLGFTFKGAGALDPRGYPILYVGAGYQGAKGPARVFIINLLDGSIMHTFGNDDPIGMRGSLSYFDSSPLVDAESDTLIYPGENGVLYLIKLNTKFNPEKGKVSINPKKSIKWRYTGVRTSTAKYWPGMETSACMFRNYFFIADNGANLICLDINTLKPVWVQDILDDSNSTPVLSVEDGKLYLYVSTSFHIGWRSNDVATIPIWKIDAETGEVVWHTDYTCSSVAGVSGGVQSTIAVGKNDLDGNIYVTVSRTGGGSNGVLACIGKKKGKVKWEHSASYAWSSPVCVYNEDGTGYVVYGTSGSGMYLLDGKTGQLLDSLETGAGTIEASPIVYGDYLVIGTRGCRIIGYKLK
ncbi:MAG: PQQ-like beta-propeller repeat protein [Lachnospiraceae bacterium]|nr:PQQ-like beta-propeller repeat protein [Lachnospiraceae bacterium]